MFLYSSNNVSLQTILDCVVLYFQIHSYDHRFETLKKLKRRNGCQQDVMIYVFLSWVMKPKGKMFKHESFLRILSLCQLLLLRFQIRFS